MTGKEIVLAHLQKSAAHCTNLGETETKISKSHSNIAAHHTDQILAQHHRALADHHGAKAQHHNDHARHLLEVHQHVSGIADAELFDSHSDAADDLRSAAGTSGFLRRVGLTQD
jgi:hypothetical protein